MIPAHEKEDPTALEERLHDADRRGDLESEKETCRLLTDCFSWEIVVRHVFRLLDRLKPDISECPEIWGPGVMSRKQLASWIRFSGRGYFRRGAPFTLPICPSCTHLHCLNQVAGEELARKLTSRSANLLRLLCEASGVCPERGFPCQKCQVGDFCRYRVPNMLFLYQGCLRVWSPRYWLPWFYHASDPRFWVREKNLTSFSHMKGIIGDQHVRIGGGNKITSQTTYSRCPPLPEIPEVNISELAYIAGRQSGKTEMVTEYFKRNLGK